MNGPPPVQPSRAQWPAGQIGEYRTRRIKVRILLEYLNMYFVYQYLMIF